MEQTAKSYLFYVRYSLSGLKVYRCSTEDPFHVIGEMVYRSFEQIDYIQFVEETAARDSYWESHNYEILDYKLKYENK